MVLLQNRASFDVRDLDRKTPLHIAASAIESANRNRLIGILVRWGADPEAKDYEGNIALPFVSEQWGMFREAIEEYVE